MRTPNPQPVWETDPRRSQWPWQRRTGRRDANVESTGRHVSRSAEIQPAAVATETRETERERRKPPAAMSHSAETQPAAVATEHWEATRERQKPSAGLSRSPALD